MILMPPTPMHSDFPWKHNEGKILNDIEAYLQSTYSQHYSSDDKDNSIQAIDLINSIGDGIPFCRSSIIKYSSRYGKKDGLSKKDCLKIIHYAVLMYHFSGHDNEILP
jgi:hypothetical protein